ncbi:hypothetical protein, partial [Paraburkholderia sp. BCC1885]|uniref:hypothetical protein n=1 Tax=Paraburkholderia sp. BCC1885 TaxID=2562669 RepID=UPI001C91D2C6
RGARPALASHWPFPPFACLQLRATGATYIIPTAISPVSRALMFADSVNTATGAIATNSLLRGALQRANAPRDKSVPSDAQLDDHALDLPLPGTAGPSRAGSRRYIYVRAKSCRWMMGGRRSDHAICTLPRCTVIPR